MRLNSAERLPWLAPSAALCNMTTCLQQQTEWISNCIQHMRSEGKSVVEPTVEAEDAWVRHHDETAGANLISKPTLGRSQARSRPTRWQSRPI